MLPREGKHAHNLRLRNSTSRYMLLRNTDLCVVVYIYSNLHSSIPHDHKNWKQPKYTYIQESIHDIYYYSTIKYYIAMKRNTLQMCTSIG